MKHLYIATLAFFALALGAPAQAEKITDERVIESFDRYMEAMGEADFEALAKYMHPGELEDFKKLFVTMGENAQKQGNFGEFAGIFEGINTLDDLKNTTPDVLFSKLFKMLTALMPEFTQILKSAEVTLLGQVREGEDEDEVLHLVFRMKMVVNGATIKTVDTTAMKLAEDGKYYFLIGEEVNGLVNALKNQFGGIN